MSTQAEYVAAAKAYANATRRVNEAEAQYNADYALLQQRRDQQATMLAELIRVARELAADVP